MSLEAVVVALGQRCGNVQIVAFDLSDKGGGIQLEDFVLSLGGVTDSGYEEGAHSFEDGGADAQTEEEGAYLWATIIPMKPLLRS